MDKHHPWLRHEIGIWQTEGIINAEQARQLQDRYPPAPDNAWGKLIFTSLGALIFGLGICLLIAYNWQGMHRFVKLALIGVTLLLVHGSAWWLRRPAGTHARVGESLHLLGTLLFGAGIWLVAQIYHLDEHYPNAYLIWSLAALGLAWAIPSVLQGLLALALVFMWSWFEVFDFNQTHHWGAWLVAFGVMPLAWQQRSRPLLFFSLSLFMALYAFTLLRVDDDLVFSALFITACACLGLARLAADSTFADSAGVFHSVGATVYLLLLFVASFGSQEFAPFERLPTGGMAGFYWGLPLLIALLAWARVLLKRPAATHSLDTFSRRLEQVDAALIITALMVAIGSSLPLAGIPQGNWLVFNLLFLAHGAILIAQGIRQLRWQWVSLGGLMLAALIFARFLDLFDSLLMRSLAFLVLGGGLFIIGARYSRQKRQHQPSQPENPHA